MASPTVFSIPQWEWVLTASSVTTGTIDKRFPGFNYYQTYRDAGSPAPSNPVKSTLPEEAIEMFQRIDQEYISSSSLIDIYVLCYTRDAGITGPGSVRVSI